MTKVDFCRFVLLFYYGRYLGVVPVEIKKRKKRKWKNVPPVEMCHKVDICKKICKICNSQIFLVFLNMLFGKRMETKRCILTQNNSDILSHFIFLPHKNVKKCCLMDHNTAIRGGRGDISLRSQFLNLTYEIIISCKTVEERIISGRWYAAWKGERGKWRGN